MGGLRGLLGCITSGLADFVVVLALKATSSTSERRTMALLHMHDSLRSSWCTAICLGDSRYALVVGYGCRLRRHTAAAGGRQNRKITSPKAKTVKLLRRRRILKIDFARRAKMLK